MEFGYRRYTRAARFPVMRKYMRRMQDLPLIISGSSAEVGSSNSVAIGPIASARDRDVLLLAA